MEAVANVPSRAAIAHSITVPLRRCELQRPVTKEGTDALSPFCSQYQFGASGERRFSERLEDDYLDWSNVPVRPKALYADLAVLDQPWRH